MLSGEDPRFHPFVKRIAAKALDDRYLVAPQGSADQANQVVWPNHGLRFKDAEFLTEDFIRAVVADVKQRHRIDDRYVFALGWSSGGPPVYAAGVDRQSSLRGLFVAMSVFKPGPLGDLAAAKGKAASILHSPRRPLVGAAVGEARRSGRERVKVGVRADMHRWATGIRLRSASVPEPDRRERGACVRCAL